MIRHVLHSLAWLAVCAAGLVAEPPNGPEADVSRSANSPRSLARQEAAEWEIIFPDDITVEEYARQMDYFKIEIAAISKNGKIEYIAHASRYKPEKRVGNRASDYRLHIGWKSGTLHAADRKLLAKAGINSQNKELWHFLPAPTQSLLAELERAYGDGARDTIRVTRFEIKPKPQGSGYEFAVVDQDPPSKNQAARAGSTAPDRSTAK